MRRLNIRVEDNLHRRLRQVEVSSGYRSLQECVEVLLAEAVTAREKAPSAAPVACPAASSASGRR